MQPIQPQKEIPPRQEFRVAGERQIAFVVTLGI